MKFPMSFQRAKPATATAAALGSDTAPPNATYPKDTKPTSKGGELGGSPLLATRMISNAGWPPHRLALVCRYDGAASPPAAINVQLFFYEDATGMWYPMTAAAVSVQPNGIPTFFDTIVPVDFANVFANAQSPNPGNIEVLVVASDPGGGAAASNGTYTFAICADQTTAMS